MHWSSLSMFLLILHMLLKPNIFKGNVRTLLHSCYLTRTRISSLFIHFIYLCLFFHKITLSLIWCYLENKLMWASIFCCLVDRDYTWNDYIKMESLVQKQMKYLPRNRNRNILLILSLSLTNAHTHTQQKQIIIKIIKRWSSESKTFLCYISKGLV